MEKQNFKKRKGSRSEVWMGLAHTTSGGLDKSMLIKNKRGKIVSKKRSLQSAANADKLKQWQFKRKKQKLDE